MTISAHPARQSSSRTGLPHASQPAPAGREHRVAIIGGGASGVLTAIQLLAGSEDPGLRVEVHEASGIVGRGRAYGTNDHRHLLNVRSRHMSAYADVPSDLIEWAQRTGRSHDPQAFLPRQEYAHYLQDTLARHADHRLSIRAGRVDDVVPVGGGFELHAACVTSRADTVVLAYGNASPSPLCVDGDPLPASAWHLPDPWDLAALRRLPADATVVVVGTGLTAVDTVITLLDDEPGRRVVMVSRHGLLPQQHVGPQSTGWVSRAPEGDLTADRLAEFVRGQIAEAAEQGVDWRNVVDGMRPITQQLWRRLPLAERRAFLDRHARTWEVHRHRMAPGVAARLDALQAQGRLEVRAGGIAGISERDGRCRVRPAVGAAVLADAVVNCTGPCVDVTRSGDPLLLALRERGLVRPDPLHLGIDTTTAGHVIGEAGQRVGGLYAVGPPRKGALWESTAVPEIRTQAAEVAGLVLADVARLAAGAA